MMNDYDEKGRPIRRSYVIKKVPDKFTMLGNEKDFFDCLRSMCLDFKNREVCITIEVIQKGKEQNE
jgi:hypothetical protein